MNQRRTLNGTGGQIVVMLSPNKTAKHGIRIHPAQGVIERYYCKIKQYVSWYRSIYAKYIHLEYI